MTYLFINNQCPGDILMLTAAIRDLKQAYPKLKVAVSSTNQYLWQNNPYLSPAGTDYCTIPLGYLTPNQTKIHPASEHFIYAFHRSIEQALGITIPRGPTYPDLHLSDEEHKPLIVAKKPILLINAGSKGDFPIKQWPLEYFQEVANTCAAHYTVVQIGETRTGKHPALAGVVDMRDKTPERKIIQLMYQASAVVTGVSFPMHLCAALNAIDGQRKCVVLAGDREDPAWERYLGMNYLRRSCGCVPEGSGCWKRLLPPRTQYSPEVCDKPVRLGKGHFYASCVGKINPEDVIKCLS